MEAIRPIETENDYKEALQKINILLESQEGTPEFDFLEALSILVDDYENKHHPIEPLDPIEAIKVEMEEKGLWNLSGSTACLKVPRSEIRPQVIQGKLF